MDKEVKHFLKTAREALKKKEYKEALKCCKAVLTIDKSNYNALVFVGASADGLDEPDQALVAYKRAIEVNPQQLLAYQGLSSFYEKHSKPEYFQDQVKVYEILMSMSDVKKQTELGLKLMGLYIKLDLYHKAIILYENLLEKDNDDSQQQDLWIGIVKMLLQRTNLDTKSSKMLKKGLSFLIKQDIQDENLHKQIWIHYLQDKYQEGDYEEAKSGCKDMIQKFPETVFARELLCEMYLNQDANILTEDEIEDTCKQLENINSDSAGLLLVKGTISFRNKQLLHAKDLLVQGLNKRESGWCWLTLSMTYLALHKFFEAIETVNKALKSAGKLPDKCHSDLLLCKVWSLVGLATPTATNEALGMIDSLPAVISTQLDMIKCHLYLIGEQWKEFDQIYSQLDDGPKTMALGGWALFKRNQFSSAEKMLKQAVAEDGSNALYHQQLGLIQLEQKNWADCFQSLLKSAKLDPYNAVTFMYIGHYYLKCTIDNQKACQCYQKAFSLDSTNDEIGMALVDTLNSLERQEAAFEILVSITSKAAAGMAKWAWMRLGLHQLTKQQYTQGITSLQSALRADPKDVHCWECLAEAYLQRGSHTAALKAFNRASQLNPDTMYSYYQAATIKKKLGLLAEAVTEYKEILDKAPDYIPALKGLGESLVSLAQTSLTHFFDLRAVKYCQQALYYLTRAASHRSDLSCIWKLMGDSCTILHPVRQELCVVNVPTKLLHKSDQPTETQPLDKEPLLALGSRCYAQALKILPECSSLWHDLGISYHRHSQLAKDTRLITNAVNAFKKAIAIDPSNHIHWLALGTVASSKEINDKALAQHCFIKSIQLEQNNVVAWANLGVLYLDSENIELAHQAFKSAQALDPSYVQSWIGQALIADMVGHEDTMDLYRHTTELSNNVEGAIGYGSWVCKLLKEVKNKDSDQYSYSIKKMNAVVLATDALAKYIERLNDNSAAFSIYGMLLERLGLYKTASTCLQRCVKLILDGKESTGTQINEARSNYARILRKSKRFKESVAEYQKISSMDKCQDLYDLALAYYEADQIKESYITYSQALDMTDNEEQKAHIHAAMGMVAYKFNDLDLAKTELFKCSQSDQPCSAGIRALCSIGFLQSDTTLASAAVQELKKQKDDDQNTVMKAYVDLMLEGWEPSKQFLSTCLQENPANDTLSALLAKQFIRLAAVEKDGHKKLEMLQNATCAVCEFQHSQELSLLYSMAGLGHGSNMKETMKTAQKAFHLNPGVESKSVLMAAVLAQSSNNKQNTDIYLDWLKQWIKQVFYAVKNLENFDSNVYEWVLQVYIAFMINVDQCDEAKHELSEALEHRKISSDNLLSLKALQALLGGAFEDVYAAFVADPEVLHFHGQVLLSHYEKLNDSVKSSELKRMLHN